MRFIPVDGSRVLIALRASGLLRALAHSPTLTAKPEALTADYRPDEGEGHVSAIFAANAIELPSDLSISDREKMRHNLLGCDVLDARKFPTIEFRGRYKGTLDGGALNGDLVVRGSVRPLGFSIRVTRAEAVFVAGGSWEGKLTDLGIKPFKALLGAIKLEDWIALHVEARLAVDG